MGATRRAKRKIGRRYPLRPSYRDLERELAGLKDHVLNVLIPENEQQQARIQLLEGIIDAYEADDAQVVG